MATVEYIVQKYHLIWHTHCFKAEVYRQKDIHLCCSVFTGLVLRLTRKSHRRVGLTGNLTTLASLTPSVFSFPTPQKGSVFEEARKYVQGASVSIFGASEFRHAVKLIQIWINTIINVYHQKH